MKYKGLLAKVKGLGYGFEAPKRPRCQSIWSHGSKLSLSIVIIFLSASLSLVMCLLDDWNSELIYNSEHPNDLYACADSHCQCSFQLCGLHPLARGLYTFKGSKYPMYCGVLLSWIIHPHYNCVFLFQSVDNEIVLWEASVKDQSGNNDVRIRFFCSYSMIVQACLIG